MFEIGQPVVRLVSEGPRRVVVHGLITTGSRPAYYVSTGIGSVHYDPEWRLRRAEHTGARGPSRT